MISPSRRIQYARAFLALEMFTEAMDELDLLDSEDDRFCCEVLMLKLTIRDCEAAKRESARGGLIHIPELIVAALSFSPTITCKLTNEKSQR